MQTITLEIADNAIYEHLVGLVSAIKGVKIQFGTSTNTVSEDAVAYNAPEIAAQHARRELFASMRGAWSSSGIENTETELKAMREEWDRNF